MTRLKFELFIQEHSTRGISSRFTDGNGRSTNSYWSSPPQNLKKEYSLETAATCYLKGRYPNIKNLLEHYERMQRIAARTAS